MVDTIKFKIPINKDVYNKIVKKSISYEKKDNLLEKTIFKVHKTDTELGSYDSNVNIFLDEINNNYLKIELSIPKFFIGNNIWLLYIDKLETALFSLRSNLINYFDVLIVDIDKWEIERLDICYAWKLERHEYAEELMQIIRNYNFPRKRTHVYESSVMFIGKTYSVKFYLKQEEFYKHDFNKWKNKDIELAYNLYEWSEGVVRFEVTLRKTALKDILKRDKIYYTDLTEELILERLNYYFNKVTHSYGKMMTTRDVIKELRLHHSDEQSLKIWQFYRLWNSEIPEDREILKKSYSRSTVWRMLSWLKEAKIGLPSDSFKRNIDLVIPSPNVVNPNSPGVA